MNEEDAPISEHTLLNPYCLDLSCWCHTDLSYHETVQSSGYHVESQPTYADAVLLLCA